MQSILGPKTATRSSEMGTVRPMGILARAKQHSEAGWIRFALLAAVAAAALGLSGCHDHDDHDAGATAGQASDGPQPPQNGGGHVIPSIPYPRLEALAASGATVGQLELAAPSITPFTLHGTFPVPRGAHLQADGFDPFRLVGPDGHVWPAQVETVTRYPRAEDGADVVEIIARVERPAGANPGDRIHFAVRFDRQLRAGPSVPQVVEDMLATPDAITLRTRDVFDHAYTADLWRDARSSSGSTRILKRGRAQVQISTHSLLMPETVVAGNQGTLPHMMGAHAYVTQFSDESFVALDLRVHNGFSGRDNTTVQDNPLGKVYFESLELVVPQGWTVVSAFDDPFLGTPYDEGGSRVYPIVEPIDGQFAAAGAGQMHMMPAMGQLQRRLALARVGSEARALAAIREEGLAFARQGAEADGREWFSWWNKVTGRWFSQRQVLPNLHTASESGVRATLAQKFNGLNTQVSNGTTGLFPIESANMGWAHPWGINDGGMVSGSEIYIFDGVDVAWAASREGYRTHELTHRMYTDRQPNVLFNVDGKHTHVSQWVVNAPGGSYMPVWWYNSPLLFAADPFGFNQAPQFQVQAVASLGKKPWYEQTLASFAAIDLQHLVRYTRSAKVLVWLGNDALSKDDMVAQAEGFRLGFSTYPQDLYGNIIPTGLFALNRYVTQYPHTGVPFGRGESWGLDAALVAYSIQDDNWRAHVRPWLHTILDVVEMAQAECSDVIQATPQYNVFGSQYRCRQSIECAIMENALVGLRETAFLGADPQRSVRTDAVLRKAFYAMISPLVWSQTHHGPWAMMAVGPFDMAQPLYCNFIPQDGNYGIADHFQLWSSFAYAWDITHDPIFLQKAAEALGVADFVSGAQSSTANNVENKAAMVALAQKLAIEQMGP